MLAVLRDGVEAMLEEAAAAGVGSVIVYASGYGEMARAESATAQARLGEIVRAAKMPMLGPNCMGLVNHVTGAGMTFIPEYARAPRNAGAIAVVSQSGALGYTLAQAWDRGVGVRYFVSAGNSADIDVADVVAALAGDENCRAIACLFEGATSAQRMLEAGERARRAGKPVVVFKLGTSEDGAAAARSHTGSLAGSAVAWRALSERAGLIQVDDYEAMLEYTRFFASAGAPLARGVAVISGSGGAGVMATDKAARHGVPMPQPLEATGAILRAIVPEFGAARNPCDPTGQVLSDPDSFGKCCRALLDDPQYGVLVVPATVALAETASKRVPEISALARAAQAGGAGLALGMAAGAGRGRLRGRRAHPAVPVHGALLRRDRRVARARRRVHGAPAQTQFSGERGAGGARGACGRGRHAHRAGCGSDPVGLWRAGGGGAARIAAVDALIARKG